MDAVSVRRCSEEVRALRMLVYVIKATQQMLTTADTEPPFIVSAPTGNQEEISKRIVRSLVSRISVR